MPTGRRMRSAGSWTVNPNAASAAATFSTKKLKYLKKPSIPKLEMTLSQRKWRRRPGQASMPRAAQ